VRRSAIAALGRFPATKAETYAALSGLIVKDIDPDAAIASLTLLKRDAWPRDNFEPLAQAVTAHAANVPVTQRDTPEFAAMLDLGGFCGKGLARIRRRDVAGETQEHRSAALHYQSRGIADAF